MRTAVTQAAVSPAVLPGRWDRIGLAVSGLCMGHCLLLPAVLSTLPLWPRAEALHAWLHPLFALVLIPTTVLAAVSGYRKHARKHVVLLLGTGLLLVLCAGVLARMAPDAAVETAVTLSGSALLIVGHWRNWRADRCCDEATACTTHEQHEHEPMPASNG